jgi:hypothetical protein
MAFSMRDTVYPIITRPDTVIAAYHSGLGIVNIGDVLPLA